MPYTQQFALLVLIAVVGSVAFGSEPKEQIVAGSVDEQLAVELAPILEQFDADSFAEREAAMRKLTAVVDARPEVWLYLTSLQGVSPEANYRIQRVVGVLTETGKRTLQFCDWQEKPLPKSWCSIYRMTDNAYAFTPGFSTDSLSLIGRLQTNDVGELSPPDIPKHQRWVVVVHAPNYGVAGTVIGRSQRRIALPLVKDGSPAAKRAARGHIVDEDGKPIVHAVVKAASVRTSFGGYGTRHDSAVLSDTDGNFRIYNPPVREAKMLPPSAKFNLHLSHNEYFPHEVDAGTLEPVTIRLRKGSSEHRFTFGGRIPDKGTAYSVAFERDDPKLGRIRLPSEYIARVQNLVKGTYHAYSPNVKFKPLIVDEDSPNVLDFEYVDAMSYTGLIVDGITSEPIDGAIVIAASAGGQNHLVDVDAEQLESLKDVDPLSWHSDPAITALNEAVKVVGVAKTDWTGQYTLALDEPIEAFSLITIAPRMLPFQVRTKLKDGAKPDERPMEVNDMYHFPSARVRFKATQAATLEEDSTERISIWPEWKFAPVGDQPKSFKLFKHAHATRHGQSGFRPSRFWVDVGSEQVLDVPADYKFDLLFTATKHQEWAPLLIKDLRLKDGELLDLGELKIQPTFPIRVRVVDHEGNPKEGVGVRHKYAVTNAWHIGKTTDDDGEVTLGVGAGLKGEFGVTELRAADGLIPANLKTPVLIEGPTEKVFEIKLTRAQSEQKPRGIPE